MTNREWLSKMSDRELAERLIRVAVTDACRKCWNRPLSEVQNEME